MSSKKRAIEIPIPRRRVLRGSLAGLATVFLSPALKGCDDGVAPLDGSVDGGTTDTGVIGDPDSGTGSPFPPREMPAPPALRSLIADIGPLGDPDANDIRLPEGFSSRVVARSGELVEGTDYEWHTAPDGGATFATMDGGWIYVSNSEIPLAGGVGAIRFDASGTITAAYRILDRTDINCAGGPTPWGTWLSCEELEAGQVYETDPWGERDPVLRPALGTFKHEAVTVDPVNGQLYLSEDASGGGFYRFTPAGMNEYDYPDLSEGLLEIAEVAPGGAVTWHEVPDPLREGSVSTRNQVAESTGFDGGEGIWHHDGVVYMSTKGDDRVWAYDVAEESMSVLYDDDDFTPVPLSGDDNITVSCCGDVLVAEDGGSMQVVAILPSGEPKPLLQIVGQDSSEITGPAFDPSGTRLYFSSQRGGSGGITYEVTGPFHEEV